ncbi:hypothetical protein VV869_06995 [Photobacterium sp. MCCC 1A19761]|uniref:hypothetical protein n=1 Tax=Photobacterium sp. MCCC 1A19761 TaxID=3115000 RepID=UPI00307F8212
MDMEKTEFFDYLRHEFQEYCAIPLDHTAAKLEKKQFINGLMKASRFFGVSYDELNDVINSQPKYSWASLEAILDVPTYIRDEIKIKGSLVSVTDTE